VFFDPNVASMASNAKIVFYGDFSSYYIRDVRNFSLERSDHFLFSKNQVAFRGLLRTDGDLLDNYALTCLTQNV
jgi:HK97 family phage major capsid protein